MYVHSLQQWPPGKGRVHADRTYEFTEARIIEASAQMFARMGYTRSSTRAIASLAGVNEVTVFRHFPRKQDLFWAATESRLGRLRVDRELGDLINTDAHPQVVLPRFVTFLVEFIQQQPETLALLYVSLFELDDEKLIRKHLVPVFEFFREYLSRCVVKGLLHHVEPEVAMLSLLASVAVQHGLRNLISGEPCPIAGTNQAPTALTTFWLEVLLPDTEQGGP